MYDIRNVGYEYKAAEYYFKKGDWENAILHYQSAVDNYEKCDNEYVLSPDSPYVIEEYDGQKTSYPSVNDMVDDSIKKLTKLKRRKTDYRKLIERTVHI